MRPIRNARKKSIWPIRNASWECEFAAHCGTFETRVRGPFGALVFGDFVFIAPPEWAEKSRSEWTKLDFLRIPNGPQTRVPNRPNRLFCAFRTDDPLYKTAFLPKCKRRGISESPCPDKITTIEKFYSSQTISFGRKATYLF